MAGPGVITGEEVAADLSDGNRREFKNLLSPHARRLSLPEKTVSGKTLGRENPGQGKPRQAKRCLHEQVTGEPVDTLPVKW
jgi:hypothetical protein